MKYAWHLFDRDGNCLAFDGDDPNVTTVFDMPVRKEPSDAPVFGPAGKRRAQSVEHRVTRRYWPKGKR